MLLEIGAIHIISTAHPASSFCKFSQRDRSIRLIPRRSNPAHSSGIRAFFVRRTLRMAEKI
jgi:hypothetical protein